MLEGLRELLFLFEPHCSNTRVEQVEYDVRQQLPVTIAASFRERPSYIEHDVIDSAFRLGGLKAAEKILWELPPASWYARNMP